MSVDIEGAVRTWLRTHPGIQAVVGHRVFLGLPETHQSCITLHLLSGGPEVGLPLDRSVLSFSCWAAYDGKARTTGTRDEAQQIRAALTDALMDLTSVDITVGSSPDPIRLLDATVLTSQFLPDTSTTPTVPRYLLDAELRAITLTPVP